MNHDEHVNASNDGEHGRNAARQPHVQAAVERSELFNPDVQTEAIIRTAGEDKWGALSEQRIQAAMERGEFDNLSGTGQRQAADEYSNPFIPPDQRMTYSMLRHSGVLPDWAVLANEIEADRARIHNFVEQHFAYLSRQMAALPDLPITKLRAATLRLKAEHEQAMQRYKASLHKLNEKINRFNAIIPSASVALPTYMVEDRLQEWQRRTPAYLEYQ